MSIGEIITTPTGLAVVVELLPTTFKLDGQVLGQVVAQPLTGGPALPVSAPTDHLGGIPYRSLVAQAATAYVAAVVERPPVATASGAWTSAAGAEAAAGAANGSSAGVAPGTGAPPPVAYALAARAYQATLDRAIQPGPIIVLVG